MAKWALIGFHRLYSVAGAAGASPRWTNHVNTYAKVFTLQSLVTFVQLGLIVPPDGLIDVIEGFLDEGDTTSNQYLAVQDLKQLERIDGSYLDFLGTPGCKLVTEAINVALLDAIFYGFATLVDGSISRRDKETIEGIKEAVYNCNTENNYIKTENVGLDALVGNVVTMLNNRKIKREGKTILGAIHEIQNRLVGKNENSKTQAMITHNPRCVCLFCFNWFPNLTMSRDSREVQIHRCLLGERLTPKEKDMLNSLKTRGTNLCGSPQLHPQIAEAIQGHRYRKVDWRGWHDSLDSAIRAINPVSFCRVNPEHLVSKDLQPDGGMDEKTYFGYVYISEKLFQMASDEEVAENNDAEITTGFSRLMQVFNTPDEWGNICIPAHPNNNTVEFGIVRKKDTTKNWKVPAGMRKMENARHVPEKRRKMLPGIVRKTIENQQNSKFSEIGEKEDYQSKVAFDHLWASTLGKELLHGPGDGAQMLRFIFDDWLSPIAIQKALAGLE